MKTKKNDTLLQTIPQILVAFVAFLQRLFRCVTRIT